MSALSAVIKAALGLSDGASVLSPPGDLIETVKRDAAGVFTLLLNDGKFNMYAQHRSHSSHSSHRSHSSHYSSSGGGSYQPAYTPPPAPPPPAPRANPPPATAPNNLYSPSTSTKKESTRPTGDELKLMIMRVQAALFSKGYDPGAIDGELNEKTKTALRSFQAAKGLKVTGTMTTETLTALGISLR